MNWTRVLAPLTGGSADRDVLAAAAAAAAPFEAETAACFAALDVADLAPWVGEGYFVGAPVAALESLRGAAQEAELAARGHFEAFAYPRKSYVRLESPMESSLAMEARLADAVVWPSDAALGRGPLASPFQLTLLVERRPCLITRGAAPAGGGAVVAWDGGAESTRAARAAAPLLAQFEQVTVLAAVKTTPRQFQPERLVDYLRQRSVPARLQISEEVGDTAQIILSAVKALGASLLVAGAYGHPRFQQFIFGGVTRDLLQAESGPALFLSH